MTDSPQSQSAGQAPRDERPVSQRLADVDQRLRALERNDGPPGSEARRWQRRVAELEAREHDHAKALAHLEGRLATVLDHLQDGRATQGETAAGRVAPEPPSFPAPPKPSLPRRALNFLHYLRYVWRRLKGQEDGPFPDQSLREELVGSADALPRLGWVVVATTNAPTDVATDAGDDSPPSGIGEAVIASVRQALARQTEDDLPYLIHDPVGGRWHTSDPALLEASGSDESLSTAQLGERLASHGRAEYLVTVTVDQLQELPAILCESLRLALAVEELDVLEVLLTPTLRPLVMRRSLWRPTPLAPNSSPWPQDAVGKIVDLASVPVAAELDRHFERRFGPYRFGKAGRLLRRRTLQAAPPGNRPADAATEPTAPLLLTSNLLGGREQLFSDLFLRLGTRRLAWVGDDDPLSRERWAQLERMRRLDGDGAFVYPLAQMIPAPLLSGVVAHLARRWRCHGLMVLGETQPGDDDTARRLAVAVSQAAEPLTVLSAPLHAAGFAYCSYDAAGGRRTAEAGLQALRRQLGWSAEGQVVLWYGDVLAGRRPEDFLSLARRFEGVEDVYFLMVGRGPLEGSVDDLARFLGLASFRRLPSLPLSFAVALSDVLCLTAPHEPLPYGLLAALAAGRPIVLPDGSPMAQWIEVHGAGICHRATPEAAEDALRRLLDSTGESPDASPLSREFVAAAVDPLWRRALDLRR